jgi:hypothetical protein
VVRTAFAGVAADVHRVSTPVAEAVSTRLETVIGKGRNALGSSYDAIAMGLTCRADVIVPLVIPVEPSTLVLRRELNAAICDWHEAKRECEIFARGHDVPWSFTSGTWGHQWLGLYTTTEPPVKVLALHARAQAKALDAATLEDVRSLALNRLPALAFTRDRLLYYLQQQRWARRNGLRRSECVFELDYLLNHYYLLLWGGLDQVCWIANGVFGLGIGPGEFGKIGAGKATFLDLLKERAPKVHGVFTDEKFVEWRKVIAGARHQAAHRSVTLASELYFTKGEEPSTAELDAAIGEDPEWKDTVATLGPAVAEQFREQFRLGEKLKRMKKAPERVLKIEVDKTTALITPLLNVEHDYSRFLEFASEVSSGCLEHLK